MKGEGEKDTWSMTLDEGRVGYGWGKERKRKFYLKDIRSPRKHEFPSKLITPNSNKTHVLRALKGRFSSV